MLSRLNDEVIQAKGEDITARKYQVTEGWDERVLYISGEGYPVRRYSETALGIIKDLEYR